MQTNLPKVSVITPTRNAKSLMEACADSVAGQTYPHLEHLVLDACSTDGTQELLARLAGQYRHLRWVSEPDDGIYDAMNKGIRMAEGEWLYFLGSDDVLKNKDVLSTIFTREDIASHDIIYGYNEFGDRGKTFGGEFSLSKLVLQNICHQAMFYRREVFEKYGSYDETYRSWSDWEMNIRLFSNDNIAVAYLPVIISKYATGGYSALHRDEKLLADLPEIIRKYIAPKHAGAYIDLLEQQKTISWLQEQCRSKDDELQGRAAQIADLNKGMSSRIDELNRTVEKQERELSRMKSSIIWKVWKQYRKIR
jgi:glycosyltransferase involved in cell wall biosynthesis